MVCRQSTKTIKCIESAAKLAGGTRASALSESSPVGDGDGEDGGDGDGGDGDGEDGDGEIGDRAVPGDGMLKDNRMHASTPRFRDLIILEPLATIERLFSLHMPQAFHYLVQSESMSDKHVRTDPMKAPMRCYKRDGRKGPAAGNKARCDRINTPHSKATPRKAKPNQTQQTRRRGAKQA
jgi:hypothetical protein